MGSGQSFPITPLAKERIVIVTGANSGTGYEIAKWTAMMGATVIMACRSEERTKQAISRMNTEFQTEKAKGTQGLLLEDELRLEFMKLDLSSFKSVMEFVEEFYRSKRSLHVLFCNAGISFEPYEKTDDGFDKVTQVNYLSHFLLICKLLGTMMNSGPDCRLLFMTSEAHRYCSFDMNTMNYEGSPHDFSPFEYYGRSKLYQMMQMYSMQRRLQSTNITVNCIHPGLVKTNIGEQSEGFMYRLWVLLKHTAGKSAERATRCAINCATNPLMSNTSGIYFDDFKHSEPSATSRNDEYQGIVWKRSFECIKQYITEDEMTLMEGK